MKLKHFNTLLCLLVVPFQSGCLRIPVLFNSSGVTGKEIGNTILITMSLMLIVVIPTVALSIWMPWKYRNSKKGTEYEPEWDHSSKIEWFAWGVPFTIVAILSVISYKTTFSLDPRKPLESDKPPLTIQVIALNWKWLFIYPEEKVASVNEIAFPVNRPIEFLVTSYANMNSFFIPKLGGQIYAMSGMENRLNIMANETGDCRGISANYSGSGFAGMRFKAKVTTEQDYQDWLAKVKSANSAIYSEKHELFVHDSRDYPVTYFSDVNPLLYKDIIESLTVVQNGPN